jgi:RHS repeat-associated protein
VTIGDEITFEALQGQGSPFGDVVGLEFVVTSAVQTAPTKVLQVGSRIIGNIGFPCAQDRWEFAGVEGQQVQLKDVGLSAPTVVFDLDGPGGWQGFVGAAGATSPYTLPTTGDYVVTARDAGGSSGVTYGFRLVELTVTDLQLSTPHNGTLIGSNQAELFKLAVPAPTELRISLDDTATKNANEVYMKLGSAPTRADYDYRFSKPFAADQTVIVPNAVAGDWFVLLYAATVAVPSTYSLLAEAKSILIDAVNPSVHGDGVLVTLTIDGAGFDQSTQVVAIGSSGGQVLASSVDAYSSSRFSATFPAGALPIGTYDVRVVDGAGAFDELTDALQIVPALIEASLETNVIAPSQVGYHQVATIWVECKNTSNVAVAAPLLVLRATQAGSEGAILKLGSSVSASGFWTSGLPEGFSHTVQFLGMGGTPGLLQPGEELRVPVQYAGWIQPWNFSYPPITFDLGVLTTDDTTPVDWSSLKPGMRPPGLSDEAWDALWVNFVGEVGTTWGDYVEKLTTLAQELAKLGLTVTDVEELLAFQFAQADAGGLVRSLSSATDAYAPARGPDIVFTRSFPEALRSRYRLGPFGYGWSHNWEYALTVDGGGAVTVVGPGDSRRRFEPDIRPGGGYFARAGDYGMLTTLGGGAFQLQEADGFRRVFDASGKIAYVEDANGHRITAGYSSGRLTTLSSGTQALTLAYHASGRLQSVSDGARTTTYTYDAAGQHLDLVTYSDGTVVDYDYSIGVSLLEEHALTRIRMPSDPAGTFRHQFFDYDGNGRLASMWRDGGAEAIIFAYGPGGEVTVTDALGKVRKVTQDHRGQINRVVDPLGNTTRLRYNAEDNLVSITDPAGFTQRYDYDALANVTAAVDPLGKATSFHYEGPFNLVKSVVDAKGHTTTFSYDLASGDLMAILYEDSTSEAWTYSSGILDSWTNRRGTSVSYEFDGAGRLDLKTYQDASTVDYIYSSRGLLSSVIDPTGTTTLTYWPDDRLRQVDYPGGRILKYAYNPAGQRKSMENELGHRLDYEYDAVGRLATVRDETAALVVDYIYDAVGRLARRELGNGVYSEYQYDDASRLKSVVNHAPGGSVLSSFSYSYDARGRRTSMTTTAGSWLYEYDDLGQLTAWVEPGGRRVAYTYDSLGNRLTVDDAGVLTAYAVSAMNRYTQVGATTYIYDFDGNLTSETDPTKTISYTYDAENRLTSVSSPTGVDSFQYNGLGNVVVATKSGVASHRVFDLQGLGNLVGEYATGGGLTKRLHHGLGLVSSRDGAGFATYYSFDGNGNTAEIHEGAGAVLDTYTYAPFGELLSGGSGPSNSFLFVGEFGVFDEGRAGQNMRARNYRPDLGRFVSEDPLGLSGGDVNLQGYAANNPMSWVDPAGASFLLPLEVLYSQPYFGDAARAIGTGVARALAWTKANSFALAVRLSSNAVLQDTVTLGSKVGVVLFGVPGVPHGYGLGARPLLTGAATKLNPYVQIALWGYQIYKWGRANNIDDSYLGELIYNAAFFWMTGGMQAPFPPTSAGGSGGAATVASSDPNQKTGPAGRGKLHFVERGSLLPYLVEFENDATATAPAQIVNISDHLDPNLEWSTFTLTGISFGDTKISIPPNSQYFETVVPMTLNGTSFEVQVDAGIHLATGEVFANFYSIDPDTGLPPDVSVGFLPPEDGTGRGQGSFSYTLKARPDVWDGTRIGNVARITFDFQETIATNQIDPHDPSKGTDPEKEAYVTISSSRRDGIPTRKPAN